MEQQTVRKTYTYKLTPSPHQAGAMENLLWRCRALYHPGLDERKRAWEQRRVAAPFAMQSAHLPGVKEARSDYRASNAQVLQDVLHRLDTT